MGIDTSNLTFFVALQASILLGLLHGISPCGHSWPILAPFCISSKNLKKALTICTFFCLGTIIACIFLGAFLGLVGNIIPQKWDAYFGMITAFILVILGIIMIVKPELLHFEDEEEQKIEEKAKLALSGKAEEALNEKNKKFRYGVQCGMFSIGFINMILPCPTASIMYTYALVSKSIITGTTIFLSYALATSLVLFIISYLIGKTTKFFRNLSDEKYEMLINRISGLLIIGFGIYMIFTESKLL
ncbi:MAG: sulfite exporter TauE/SafE family protein [Candidatus Schekmanbacteria bacterium]|nr:MAG: sulfite exporter TauE/SafE family protein [Candidatus Schekmanbacteria bacterium]